MARKYEPMRTLYAVQELIGGTWETLQLFGAPEFALASIAKRNQPGRLRMEPVQREIFD